MSDTTGSKQRLLIVDDSRVIRVTARKILQNHFETVEAVSGENAWEILSSEAPFSLVVSDLTMPGMDGFGLLEKIRGSHLPHISGIPVIIITGANDSEATKQRATAAGATDFIGKPFDAVHLLARTQAHAEAYSTEQSLTQETMELEDHALTDPASGLPNEAAFNERGQQLLAYAVRHDCDLALFSIDIDDFGDLFKQYGDQATTAAVKAVAGVLSSCVRQEDMAARIGSSRFALLLPDMGRSGIRTLADRIIADMGKHQLGVDGKQVPLSVSIGVAAPDISGETRFDAMLTAATANLQTALRRGGNQAVLPASFIQEQEPPQDQSTSADDTGGALHEEAPEAVTDPLPDLEVVGTGEDSIAEMQPAAVSHMAFAAEAHAEDETIVITAPGDYFPDDEAPAADTAAAAQSDTADGAATATVADPEATGEAESTDGKVRKRGMLSRLWRFITFRR